MPIQILPAELANQIAAGEVVERPASVVKELVENSIDAGASRIDIDIERGGHKRIKISDDGSGINKDELPLALSRHATSKIRDLEDLEHILSMGFRGEALASISSVSRLTLQSRPLEQEEGWQAHAEGREMQVHLSPCAHPHGTTVDVQDIFYNTPARRKFLRTEKTEFMHIEEVVRRLALCHFHIGFRLSHNNKLVKHYPAISDKQHHLRRLTQICQKRFCEQAVWIECEYDGMRLTGWLGSPAAARSQNDLQYSFVNQRVMRDKVVNHAIRSAFEGLINSEHFPAFVVYLEVAPEQVDVNVHPAKHEVRFHRAREVHNFIYKSILEALQSAELETISTEFRQSSSSQPNHDYIQPLRPQHSITEKTKGGYRSDVTRHAGPAVLQANWQTSSNQKQPALYAYREVLAIETPQARLTVMPFGDKGDLIERQQSLYFLRPESLLLQMLKLASDAGELVRQPLLMPVAVCRANVQLNTAQLTDQGFIIATVGQKLILKEVPSFLREQPWSQIFPSFGAANTNAESGVLELIKNMVTYGDVSVELRNKCWREIERLSDNDDWLLRCAKALPLDSWLDENE